MRSTRLTYRRFVERSRSRYLYVAFRLGKADFAEMNGFAQFAFARGVAQNMTDFDPVEAASLRQAAEPEIAEAVGDGIGHLLIADVQGDRCIRDTLDYVSDPRADAAADETGFPALQTAVPHARLRA